MALPVTRRHSLMLLGASAASSLASPSLGQQEIPEIDYEYLGMFPPQEPNADRPYFYYRFDSDTKASHPSFRPAVDIPVFQRDKFILINFIDPLNRERSGRQMQLLDASARHYRPIIEPKEYLVADVVVRTEDGQPIYIEDYELLYKDNDIGVNGSNEDRRILPFGVAFSSPLRTPDLGVQRLLDFSVSRVNPTEEQMHVNIKEIIHNLGYYAEQVSKPTEN